MVNIIWGSPEKIISKNTNIFWTLFLYYTRTYCIYLRACIKNSRNIIVKSMISCIKSNDSRSILINQGHDFLIIAIVIHNSFINFCTRIPVWFVLACQSGLGIGIGISIFMTDLFSLKFNFLITSH